MQNQIIQVLDHGHVRLVESMGSDLSIVRNARVSYDADWRSGEDDGKDAKLLNYLLKNKHTSPFESCVFTFDVKAPIFVFRQWHRHRTWCLSGDTELWFKNSKVSIKEFHDRWHNIGQSQCAKGMNKPTHHDKIDSAKYYSISDLSFIVDRNKSELRNMFRRGILWGKRVAAGQHEDQIYVLGQSYIDWASLQIKIAKSAPARYELSQMKLRAFNEATGQHEFTTVADIWETGEKEVFELHVGPYKIKATDNHKFLTTEGWKEVKDIDESSTLIVYVRKNSKNLITNFLPIDWEKLEVWKSTTHDGYEVSNMGRVRSYFGQGRRTKQSTPIMKRLTPDDTGRKSVNIGGNVLLVARLVYEAFVAPAPDAFICHKDDNPANDQLDNLYAGDAKTNSEDAPRNNSYNTNQFSGERVKYKKLVGVEKTYDLTVDSSDHNFVANGFVTHNCFNEVSARYSALPEEFYVSEPGNYGTQSSSNKQMRNITEGVDGYTADEWAKFIRWEHEQREIMEQCFVLYRAHIAEGMPRELARSVLPVGTYSHMFATVNLLNLFRFLQLRLHSHSQYEIRVYAEAMLALIEPIVPISVKGFKEHWL